MSSPESVRAALQLSDSTTCLRIGLACVFGALIGAFQKYLNFHRLPRYSGGAAVRTHALVSMGACLVQLVGMDGFVDHFLATGSASDPSRISAQVVSGLGFLGAGTIIRHRGSTIRGLTAAASLWVAGAIGIATGVGKWFSALIVTAFTCFILLAVKSLEDFILTPKSKRIVYVSLDKDPKNLLDVMHYVATEVGAIDSIQTVQAAEHTIKAAIHISIQPEFYENLEANVIEIAQMTGVKYASLRGPEALHSCQFPLCAVGPMPVPAAGSPQEPDKTSTDREPNATGAAKPNSERKQVEAEIGLTNSNSIGTERQFSMRTLQTIQTE